MATQDVTVFGAGVLGLSVAYACAQRGARVRVIDPGGVAAGASGGIVGALAPHVPEKWNDKKEFQLDSLMLAPQFWAKVEALSGLGSGYARTGRLQPLADARAVDLARSRTHEAQDLWRGQAIWEVVSASSVSNWSPPSASGLLIHDTLSALIHPRRATQALAGAFQSLGGEILRQGQARGQVVHATGWQGLIEISQALGDVFGNGVKGQAMLLDHDARGRPQLFANGIHVVPHGDGTTAIGSTSERYFDDPTSTDEQLDALHERALANFPMLNGAAVLGRWAGVRPRALNRAPILGRHPLRPAEFITNGGFKIGFGMAPKIGAAMADLILDGINQIPPDFTPEANLGG